MLLPPHSYLLVVLVCPLGTYSNYDKYTILLWRPGHLLHLFHLKDRGWAVFVAGNIRRFDFHLDLGGWLWTCSRYALTLVGPEWHVSKVGLEFEGLTPVGSGARGFYEIS